MRRLLIFTALLLLLGLSVSAFSGVDRADYQTAVAQDGSCQVNLTLHLQITDIPSSLVFPLPAQAEAITVNGTPVSGIRAGNVRNIDLTGHVAAPGQYTLVIRYRIPDAISADRTGNLNLTLELLSGFDYPIDSLAFSITLPGESEEKPVFSSTYYPNSIDMLMTVTQQGNVISGQVNGRLQDHEKLTMTLSVPREMFPQPMVKRWSMDTLDIAMIVLGVLTFVYWLVALPCAPMRRQRCCAPPEGISAGEVHSRLTARGADFTLTVISWAQMGYILIQPDGNGRILLHKRMEMGNERSNLENKWFRMLFGRRTVINGSGEHYALLCRDAARVVPGAREQFLPNSGNSLVMRVLASLAGSISGISLATAYAGESGWEIPLAFLMALAGAVAAWLMQGAAAACHSRSRAPLFLALTAAVLWLLLSTGAGEWNVALILIPLEFLSGFAAFFGGRRSETGKAISSEILGLRHYLRTIHTGEAQRILAGNPYFYYDLAPYALALGVDRAFARQLADTKLPPCPWLTTGMDGHMTAREWNRLLRRTADALDARQKRLLTDRLLGK